MNFKDICTTSFLSKSLFFFFFSIFTYGQQTSLWDSVSADLRKTKSFKRYEDFYRKRSLPDDQFPNEKFSAALQNEISLELQQKGKNIQQKFTPWTNVGPLGITYTFPAQWGVCSGRIRGMAIHPSDPNTVYVGPAAGGLWKTTNGGDSWREVSNSTFSAITFGAITIDPNSPNTIYAGTGEARYSFNSTTFNGDGLYKSTDGGTNWIRITTLGTSTHFSSIKVSPFNSNILLAALAQGYWKAAYPASAGVWRSSDAGLNWTKIIDSYNAYDVSFDPSVQNRAYAACGGADSKAGFYVSTNNGTSFTLSGSGLPAASNIGRIQFTQALSNTSKIYAIVYHADNITLKTEVYLSANSGASWSQLAAGKQFGGTYNGTNYADQGSYDLCIAVSPVNETRILLGNVELMSSADAQTFSYIRFGSNFAWSSACHVDYHVIAFSPSSPSTVYLGCDGGVYKSTDGGATWNNKNNGISTIQFYRLASHPKNSSIIHGGAQDNGNFITTDQGVTNWTSTTTGDGMETFYSITGDTLFAATQNGNFMRKDGTNAFVGISPPWTGTNPAWTAPFFRNPKISHTIYAANNYFWKSTNAGTNWTRSAASLSSSSPITSVAQSPVNTNKMIAALSQYTNSPLVFVSTDEGSTWTSVTANLPSPTVWIERVKFHPTEENTVFAVLSGFTGARVLRSTNMGSSWVGIGGNLPQIPCNDIFIDPLYTNRHFVANDFGVYYSEDSGVSYTRLSDGIPYVPVVSFSYYSYNGTRLLRAGSHGRGIFQLNLDQGSVFSLSGKITYANISVSPIKNAKVLLIKQGVTIDSVITDASGNYLFNSVQNGTYNIKLKNMPVAGGVNSTDALQIRRYLAGLSTFDSLQIKAADINLSGSINSTDALLIRRRLALIDTAFTAGDWVFENPYIVINNSAAPQNIRVLCTGDVNGTFLPVVLLDKSTGYVPFIKQRKTTINSLFANNSFGMLYTGLK